MSGTFFSRISTVFESQLIFLLLILAQILQQPSCLVSSSSNNNKFGVHMIRSPESNIAPQGDEVQFECELNLEPDRLEWRFLPQDRLGDNKNDYIYMSSNVSTFNHEDVRKIFQLCIILEWIQCYTTRACFTVDGGSQSSNSW